MTTTDTLTGRHEPTAQPACGIERSFGEHRDDGTHVCNDGPGHFVLGRPHACRCGYTWEVQGQAHVDDFDLRERINRWRSIADFDARAGAPVGDALRDACNELDRLQSELAEAREDARSAWQNAEDWHQVATAKTPADVWVVPKVPVDVNPHVRPRILPNGLIRRDAGDSTPAHTLQYVGQLLAAVDEVGAQAKETGQ